MFSLLPKYHNVDEAHFFFQFFCLLEAPAGRQTKASHRSPARRIPQLGIAGQIADQNDFIEARQRWLLAMPVRGHPSVEQALALTSP